MLRREVPNLRAAWRLIREQGHVDDAVTMVIALADAAGWRDFTEIWSWSRELVTDPAVATQPRRAAVLGVAAMKSWLRGDLRGADALASQGLDVATDDDDRYWCLAAQAEVELSRGGYPAAIERGLHAVAAVYAGDLDRAGVVRDRLAGLAAAPTSAARSCYVAGEIDNAAGRHDQAEAHYRRSKGLRTVTSAMRCPWLRSSDHTVVQPMALALRMIMASQKDN